MLAFYVCVSESDTDRLWVISHFWIIVPLQLIFRSDWQKLAQPCVNLLALICMEVIPLCWLPYKLHLFCRKQYRFT